MNKILKFETVSEFENYGKELELNTLYLIGETNDLIIKEEDITFYIDSEYCEYTVKGQVTWENLIMNFHKYCENDECENFVKTSDSVDETLYTTEGDMYVYYDWCQTWGHLGGGLDNCWNSGTGNLHYEDGTLVKKTDIVQNVTYQKY